MQSSKKPLIVKHHEWVMEDRYKRVHEGQGEPLDLSCRYFDDIILEQKSLSRGRFFSSHFRDSVFHEVEAKLANFEGADFEGAHFERARFVDCDFSNADFRGAHFSETNFLDCDLSKATFRNARVMGRPSHEDGARIKDCKTLGVDWSGVEGFHDPVEFMKSNFETDDLGFIVFKAFSQYYPAPSYWTIEPGSILRENVTYSRSRECAPGINVASLAWVKQNMDSWKDIWIGRIRYEWLVDVVVPFDSDGKIRTGWLELLQKGI